MTAPWPVDEVGQRLRKIARDYEERGYDVRFDVPVPVDEGETAIIDVVARAPGETVLIEGRASVSSGAHEPDLRRLARYAQSQPGTRLELVVVGRPRGSDEDDSLDASGKREVLRRRLREAGQVLATGHADGALLLAWSAIEGALDLLEEQYGLSGRTIRRRADFRSLYSESLLSKWHFDLLEDAFAARSRVAHGFAEATDPKLVEDLIELAGLLLDPERPLVGDMIDWFEENFEDPAHSVPHESRAGGYLYPAGEPHAAREVLEARFPNAHERDVDEACRILEDASFEWVRKGDG